MSSVLLLFFMIETMILTDFFLMFCFLMQMSRSRIGKMFLSWAVVIMSGCRESKLSSSHTTSKTDR